MSDLDASTGKELDLTDEDVLSLRLSHPSILSSLLLDSIATSESHSSASHAFSLMRIATMSTPNCLALTQTVLSADVEVWKEILGKFLKVNSCR